MEDRIIIDDLFENYDVKEEQMISRCHLLEVLKKSDIDCDKMKVDILVDDGLLKGFRHLLLIGTKGLKFYILENGQIIIDKILAALKSIQNDV